MARFDYIAAYILANYKRGTTYIGCTSDLPARMEQHRMGEGAVFPAKYDLKRLVWFERFEGMALARQREKRLKEWKRDWKIALIEERNPDWRDLSAEVLW